MSNEIGSGARVKDWHSGFSLGTNQKAEDVDAGGWVDKGCILGMFSSVHFHMLHEGGNESQDETEGVGGWSGEEMA